MSIPYLPGWWDEISKNATGLAQQLPQFIQPDRVANKRLQDMVQQNPMILEQITNMDAGTRQLLERSFGFQNQSPLSQLPVGAQRQERELNMGMMQEVMQDPTAREEYKAGKFNLLRPTQRKKEQQDLAKGDQEIKFNDLNFEKLSGDVELGKLLNNEKMRSLRKLEEYRLNTKGGIDPQRIVRAIINQTATPADLEAYSVMKNEPGVGEAVDMMIEMGKLGLQNRYNMGLRLVGQQDDFLKLSIGAVNSAANQYNQAAKVVNDVIKNSKLAGISIEKAFAADPTLKERYDSAISIRDEAKGVLDMYRPIVQKGFERNGAKFPEVPTTGTETPVVTTPNDPELDKALRAIANGSSRAFVARKYKERTGKDLPR